MKLILIVFLILQLFQVSYSQDDNTLVCYISKKDDLRKCYNNYDSQIYKLSMIQEKNSKPDIEGLPKLLASMDTIKDISLTFYDVQDPSPLYKSFLFQQYSYIELNFKGFKQFDQSKLNQMLQVQYQNLQSITLDFQECTEDYVYLANVISNLKKVDEIKLYTSPDPVQNKSIQNLQVLEGLFKNCQKLEYLFFQFINTDWSQQNKKYFSKIFNGVENLKLLAFSLENNYLKDVSFLVETISPIAQNLETVFFDVRIPIKSYSPLKTIFDQMKTADNMKFVTGYTSKNDGEEYIPTKECFESMQSLFAGMDMADYIAFTMVNVNAQNLDFKYFENTFNNPVMNELDIYINNAQLESLKNINTVFENLDKLQDVELNISQNNISSSELSELRDTFSKNTLLNSLDIEFQDNKINNLDDFVINAQKSIEFVNLNFDDNQITSLEPLEKVFIGANNIKQLYLNFNNNCLNQPVEFYIEQVQKVLPTLQNYAVQVSDQDQDGQCNSKILVE